MNCEKCGTPLKESTKFCPSCGTKVATAVEAVTEPVEAAEAPQAGKGFAIASMICGIASIVFCCLSYFGLILGIAGIVLGIVSKKKTTEGCDMALVGIITGAIGAVFALSMIIIVAATYAVFGGMTLEHFTDFFMDI